METVKSNIQEGLQKIIENHSEYFQCESEISSIEGKIKSSVPVEKFATAPQRKHFYQPKRTLNLQSKKELKLFAKTSYWYTQNGLSQYEKKSFSTKNRRIFKGLIFVASYALACIICSTLINYVSEAIVGVVGCVFLFSPYIIITKTVISKRRKMYRKYNQDIEAAIPQDIIDCENKNKQAGIQYEQEMIAYNQLCKKYKSRYQTDLKNYDVFLQKQNEKIDQLKNKCVQIYDECRGLDILPEPFCLPNYSYRECHLMRPAPNMILDYFKLGRVSTVKEGINLYIAEDRARQRDNNDAAYQLMMMNKQDEIRISQAQTAREAELRRIAQEESAQEARKAAKYAEVMCKIAEQSAKETKEHEAKIREQLDSLK